MSRRIGWVLFGVFVLLSVLSMVQDAEADTRGIRVIARDKTTDQQEEIRLYRRMIAVIIGIDRYPNLSYDQQLSYAVSDAKAIERTLRERFQFDHIYTLHNEQATREAIVELLEGTLAKTDREDAVFVFFAGHAITEKTEFGEVGYLVPCDGTFKREELYRNLSMSQLKTDTSRRIKAKHVFYVVDACYGGLLLALRGSDRETGHDLGYLREMTREPVRQVLTAGSKDQPVLDGGPKGHSVFTGRLIEALERTTDYITAGELSERIKRKVYSDAQARGHVQTPQDGALFGTGDFVFVPKVVASPQPEEEIEKWQREKQEKDAEIERLQRELEAEKARQEAERKAKEAERLRKELEVLKKKRKPAVTPASAVRSTPSRTSSDVDMVWIPGGTFQMGSNNGDKDERPVHTVMVDGFWMDKYEVTVAQLREFCRTTRHRMPAQPNWNKDNHPVVNVRWYDAQAYAKWAGKRLPTEAEWEKAARGGLVGKEYPWENRISHNNVNYEGTGGRDRWKYTAPVGSFPPNGYGLYDMAGNVWEWCADWYDSGYYGKSPENNPTGPATGTSRVVRGGSWGRGSYNLRCADRTGLEPSNTWRDCVAFRCVRPSTR